VIQARARYVTVQSKRNRCNAKEPNLELALHGHQGFTHSTYSWKGMEKEPNLGLKAVNFLDYCKSIFSLLYLTSTSPGWHLETLSPQFFPPQTEGM
jgi:hypothetical protein